MANPTDLLGILGGSGFTLAVLLSLSAGVLGKRTRSPGLGWTTLGAGLLLLMICTAFSLLSVPLIWASWTSSGPVSAILVVLNLAWLLSLAIGITVLINARRAMRYLAESYHPDAIPPLLKPLRQWAASKRNRSSDTTS